MRFATRVPVILVFCVVSTTSFAQTPLSPLPCTLPEAKDIQPWVHNSAVLDSFPKVKSPPVSLGTFRDRNSQFILDLYRDGAGIFGEISSPVLDADSPTSQLYSARLEGKFLYFESRVPSDQMSFAGMLVSGVIKGRAKIHGRHQKVTLKKTKPIFPAFEFVSRAQFDCAMHLWRRN